jgi:adenosylhomocysteine nucleosidase
MKKIGIIGAMEVEISFLRKMMESDESICPMVSRNVAGLHFFEGGIAGTSVVLVRSGIGKVNAALCAQQLITIFGVTQIINTGIAGAISHELQVLDMVVSTEAVYHDFDTTGFGYKPTVIPQMPVSVFRADDEMRIHALDAFSLLQKQTLDGKPDFTGHSIFSGRIASGDQFVSSGTAKNHIREICDPVCVEMEGAAIGHTCYLNSVPFLIIRCISDLADENGNAVYSFNEETAGVMSGLLVMTMLKML